jgi:serine/threonine protein kinase, bacterial
MALTSGAIFAGFKVVRLLGSGGMGEVYLVQHPRLPRSDALKVLPSEMSADPEYRERFIREAELAGTLWHPNIVGVHDRGEFDGQLWISMDYVAGTNAADLLKDRNPNGMPPVEVAKIVTAIASALDYAHKCGLLHRDVKPANIMLTEQDDDGERRILLSDFGIARSIGSVSGLTATNMTVGTVAYCAPEQLMGEEIDGRADQYALAASTYHLLTGSQLFPHSNPAVVISRHISAPVPMLAETRPELGKFDPVLACGLAKDPDDRFAQCTDFARAFAEQTKTGRQIYSTPTAPALPVAKPGPADRIQTSSKQDVIQPAQLGSPRLRWIISAATLTALLVGAVALIWRPWQQGPSSNPTTPGVYATPTIAASPPSATRSIAPPPVLTTTWKAQPTDYSSLLVKASDIGGDLSAPQPPVLNPNGAAGVAQLFANPDNSRRIGDTILIVADPATAAAGLDNTKTNYAGKVSGAWQPVDVGSNGALISGTSPDNSQAITVLLFTEGKALVNIEFDSAPSDPIDADIAKDIGRKQDAAIKKGLPG